MTIQVTGKNVDAGEAFKVYISDKIKTVLDKYLDRDLTGHIRLEKERGLFKTACSLKLASGLLLEANGEAGDAYHSADAAVERLEARLRRHRQRLKNHHNMPRDGIVSEDVLNGRDYVLSLADDDVETEVLEDNPLVIAETTRPIRELPVSEAVMQLDVSEENFLVFRNARHGGLNVVYRRTDGNIGWIDAEPGQGAAVANGIYKSGGVAIR